MFSLSPKKINHSFSLEKSVDIHPMAHVLKYEIVKVPGLEILQGKLNTKTDYFSHLPCLHEHKKISSFSIVPQSSVDITYRNDVSGDNFKISLELFNVDFSLEVKRNDPCCWKSCPKLDTVASRAKSWCDHSTSEHGVQLFGISVADLLKCYYKRGEPAPAPSSCREKRGKKRKGRGKRRQKKRKKREEKRKKRKKHNSFLTTSKRRCRLKSKQKILMISWACVAMDAFIPGTICPLVLARVISVILLPFAPSIYSFPLVHCWILHEANQIRNSPRKNVSLFLKSWLPESCHKFSSTFSVQWTAELLSGLENLHLRSTTETDRHSPRAGKRCIYYCAWWRLFHTTACDSQENHWTRKQAWREGTVGEIQLRLDVW